MEAAGSRKIAILVNKNVPLEREFPELSGRIPAADHRWPKLLVVVIKNHVTKAAAGVSRRPSECKTMK